MSPEARAKYFEAGHAAGLLDSEIEVAIAEIDRENAALDSGRCPRCGEALYRRRDTRQAGPHNVPGGVWYKYTCAACHYFSDRAEV